MDVDAIRSHHEELKCHISRELIARVEAAGGLDRAISIVEILDVEDACVVLDCVFLPLAAFIFLGISARAQQGYQKARQIADQAMKLELECTKGLDHARAEFFAQTGVRLA